MNKKTAIITGSSSGIGKEVAKLFLKNEFNVVMNARSESKLQKAFEEFGSPINAVIVPGDISDKKIGIKLADAAVNRFGSLDVLVNNAGIFWPKPFLEVEEHELDTFYNINLKGTFFTTQAAIKEMINLGGGSIINIGTVLIEYAMANLPAAAPLTSKGGIHALTKQLAAEFGKFNIRVNTIAPGVIRTPLLAKNGVTNIDDLAHQQLLGHIGEPKDIAEMALYLSKSNFITGESIKVDGGQVVGNS